MWRRISASRVRGQLFMHEISCASATEVVAHSSNRCAPHGFFSSEVMTVVEVMCSSFPWAFSIFFALSGTSRISSTLGSGAPPRQCGRYRALTEQCKCGVHMIIHIEVVVSLIVVCSHPWTPVLFARHFQS
ncbi:unnamed protein product, partial [Scytosiphon promiscuus]